MRNELNKKKIIIIINYTYTQKHTKAEKKIFKKLYIL